MLHLKPGPSISLHFLGLVHHLQKTESKDCWIPNAFYRFGCGGKLHVQVRHVYMDEYSLSRQPAHVPQIDLLLPEFFVAGLTKKWFSICHQYYFLPSAIISQGRGLLVQGVTTVTWYYFVHWAHSLSKQGLEVGATISCQCLLLCGWCRGSSWRNQGHKE